MQNYSPCEPPAIETGFLKRPAATITDSAERRYILAREFAGDSGERGVHLDSGREHVGPECHSHRSGFT
jgi:hypothetical protein